MNDQNQDDHQRRLDISVAESKAGIARLIEPHAARGAGGVMTVALIELGIERHLDRFPDEKGARDLVNGVLTKVLKRRSAG
jgi:hypothetical protein